MVIYLDYFRPIKSNITDIAVSENGRVKFYRYRNLPGVIQELGGRELIVVFERPYRNFKKTMIGYEHLLKDMNVNKRWYDLHVIMRKETEKALTLGRIAEATLGESEDTKISRLEDATVTGLRSDRDAKMKSRLKVLEAVFKYALRADQLSYRIGNETHWAELNINENIDLD